MLQLLVGMLWQKLFMLVYLIGIHVVIAKSTNMGFFYYALLGDNSICFFYSNRLVDKINRSVGQDVNSPMQIGVLDIYGFECFKDNR